MVDNLFRRILEGRTPKKEESRKPETAPTPDDKSNIVEKALSVPVSRRSILGGAATTAGAIAGSTGIIGIPQPPIMREAASAFLKDLTPMTRGLLGNLETYRTFVSHEPHSYINAPDVTHIPTEQVFTDTIPLDSVGNLDGDAFKSAVYFIGNLDETLRRLSGYKLDDLLNEGAMRDALEMSGEIHGVNQEGGLEKMMDQTKELVEYLRKISGLESNQPLSAFRDVLRKKLVSATKRMLAHPEMLPPLNSNERSALFGDFFQVFSQASGYSEVDPALRKFVEEEYFREVELYRQRDQKRRTDWEKEYKESGKRGDVEERKRLNEELIDRESISCVVRSVYHEPRDQKDARAFLIIPQDNKSPELTRMHIQHLRQQLTYEGLLDSFDPADTKVEVLGNRVRVSTMDKRFQEYLSSFTEGNDTLSIPNRLQRVIPPEKEES